MALNSNKEPFQGSKNKKDSDSKDKSSAKKRGSKVTVADLIDKLVNDKNDGANYRAVCFLNLIKEDLVKEKSIESDEDSRRAIIINELVTNLSLIIDKCNGGDPQENECNLLKRALLDMKKLNDNLNINQMKIFSKINESIKMDIDVDHLQNCNNNNNNSNVACTSSYNNTTADTSSNSTEYFDRSVVAGALREYNMRLKTEPGFDILPPIFKINKLSNFKTTYLKFVGDSLICVNNKSNVTRYSFKGSSLNHIPVKTKILKLSSSTIIEIIVRDKYMILGTTDGSILKTSLKCKLKDIFKFNKEIHCMCEYEGILYISTACRKIHSLNHIALTHQQDALEFDYLVKSLKVTTYYNVPVLVCLTDTGSIVGLYIKPIKNKTTPCLTGEMAFRFEADANWFNVRLNNDCTTFFCANIEEVTRFDLIQNELLKFDLARTCVTCMMLEKNYLFVGSKHGDIHIINTETKVTYHLDSIAQGQILSMVFIPTLVYIGSDDGLRCLYLEGIPDL